MYVKIKRTKRNIYTLNWTGERERNTLTRHVSGRTSQPTLLTIRDYTSIELFGVSSHLIKPGGVRRGCAQVNMRVTLLGGQEAIKIVGSCCAFGCPNRVGMPPGTRRCHQTPSIKTRIDCSHFVTDKFFTFLLARSGSVPDCCIILGRPDDKVNHIDYATTLFAFT